MLQSQWAGHNQYILHSVTTKWFIIIASYRLKNIMTKPTKLIQMLNIGYFSGTTFKTHNGLLKIGMGS